MPRWDFFISYAGPDRDWAEWIVFTLRKAGYRVAVDFYLEAGTDWVSAIREMIAESAATICVVSPAYAASAHSQDDWFETYLGGTLKGRYTILPIRVEEAPVPPLLRTRLSVELVGVDPTDAANVLLEAVARIRRKPTVPPIWPGPSGVEGPQFRPKVFISYSHKDQAWLERLVVFLRPLEREKKLDIWDDRRIGPGKNWRDEIAAALSHCRIAIPLISSDFLASDFILDEELPKMLQAAESDGVVVMPVILRPSRFHRSGIISTFQCVNPPSAPLSSLRRHQWEKIFADFADIIEDTLGRRN